VCFPGFTKPNADGLCVACGAGNYNRARLEHFEAMLEANVPDIVSRAEDWNTVTGKFDSTCAGQTCAGNTGARTSGTATAGSQTGHGAGGAVTVLGGDTGTKLHWGAGSIASAFAICSVTRYAGSTKQRILHCTDRNWLHGHWTIVTVVFIVRCNRSRNWL